MASVDENICTNYPDFAVICSFITKFGDKFNHTFPNIGELQTFLENTDDVNPLLIQTLHCLLRRVHKSQQLDRWEKGIQKFAHSYSHEDGWELESGGFKKARLEVKLRVLKNLLERQFDLYKGFKEKVNVISSRDLRLQPCGRDKYGVSYWCQMDDCANLRIYKDDQDEETWSLVAQSRDELVKLIDELERKIPSKILRETSVEDSLSENTTPVVLSQAPTPVDSAVPTPDASGCSTPIIVPSEKSQVPEENISNSDTAQKDLDDNVEISDKLDNNGVIISDKIDDNMKTLENVNDSNLVIASKIEDKVEVLKKVDSDVKIPESVDNNIKMSDNVHTDFKTSESVNDDVEMSDEVHSEKKISDNVGDDGKISDKVENDVKTSDNIDDEKTSDNIDEKTSDNIDNEKTSKEDDVEKSEKEVDAKTSKIVGSVEISKNDYNKGISMEIKENVKISENDVKISEIANKDIKISEKVDDDIKLSEKEDDDIKLSEKVDDDKKLTEKVDEDIKLSEKVDDYKKLSEKVDDDIKLSDNVDDDIKLSEKVDDDIKLSEKVDNDIKLSEKVDNDINISEKECKPKVKEKSAIETVESNKYSKSGLVEDKKSEDLENSCDSNYAILQPDCQKNSIACKLKIQETSKSNIEIESSAFKPDKSDNIPNTSINKENKTKIEGNILGVPIKNNSSEKSIYKRDSEDSSLHSLTTKEKDAKFDTGIKPENKSVHMSIQEELKAKSNANKSLKDGVVHKSKLEKIIDKFAAKSASEASLKVSKSEKLEMKLTNQSKFQMELNKPVIIEPNKPIVKMEESLETPSVIDYTIPKNSALEGVDLTKKKDSQEKANKLHSSLSIEEQLAAMDGPSDEGELQTMDCSSSKLDSDKNKAVEDKSSNLQKIHDPLENKLKNTNNSQICNESKKTESSFLENKENKSKNTASSAQDANESLLTKPDSNNEKNSNDKVQSVSNKEDKINNTQVSQNVAAHKSISGENKPNISKTDIDLKSVSDNAKSTKLSESVGLNLSSVPGEAIEEPVMIIKGDGEGSLCDSAPWWENFEENNMQPGEEIQEEVMYIWGFGTGAECDTGNSEDEKEAVNTDLNRDSQNVTNSDGSKMPNGIKTKNENSSVSLNSNENEIANINKIETTSSNESKSENNDKSSQVKEVHNQKEDLSSNSHQVSTCTEESSDHCLKNDGMRKQEPENLNTNNIVDMNNADTEKAVHLGDSTSVSKTKSIKICNDASNCNTGGKSENKTLQVSPGKKFDKEHGQSEKQETSSIKDKILKSETESLAVKEKNTKMSSESTESKNSESTDNSIKDEFVKKENIKGISESLQDRKPETIAESIKSKEVKNDGTSATEPTPKLDKCNKAEITTKSKVDKLKKPMLESDKDDVAETNSVSIKYEVVKSKPESDGEVKTSIKIKKSKNVSKPSKIEKTKSSSDVKKEEKSEISSDSIKDEICNDEVQELDPLDLDNMQDIKIEKHEIDNDNFRKFKGRGRPKKALRPRSQKQKHVQDADEVYEGDEDEEVAKKKIEKPEPEITRHRSARIAKIREREETNRRELEAIRMKQLAEENRLKELKRKARDERRAMRQIKKEHHHHHKEKKKEKVKKKRKKKKKGKVKPSGDPWAHSSTSSSSSSEEIEIEIEEDNEELVFKSDHEFSPESDIGEEDAQPIKRARTARKVKGETEAPPDPEEVEEKVESDAYCDTKCMKCDHEDHPETILLCDICDSGWHLSCLRPPLLSVPEGDWICPTCEHIALIEKLKGLLEQFDATKKKNENEELRKQRLAYINVSLDNVLPDKRKRESGSESESDSEGSETDSDSSLSGNSSESGPLYTLRARPSRTPMGQVEDFDELINEAIRSEVEAAAQIEYRKTIGRGKDIANIMKGEQEEDFNLPENEDEEIEKEKEEEEKKEQDDSGESNVKKEDDTEKKDINKEEKESGEPKAETVIETEPKRPLSDDEEVLPPKKVRKVDDDSDYVLSDKEEVTKEVTPPRSLKRPRGRGGAASSKKRRRLTDLDAIDDEDDSDEDFKGTSDDDESDEVVSEDFSLDIDSSSDSDSGARRRPTRRSTRGRRKLSSDYDSELDTPPRRKRGSKSKSKPKKRNRYERETSSDDSDEDYNSSDESYGKPKKSRAKALPRKKPRKKKAVKKKPAKKKGKPATKKKARADRGNITFKSRKKRSSKDDDDDSVVVKGKIAYAKPVNDEGEEVSARRVTRGRQINFCDTLFISDEEEEEEQVPKSRGKVMKGERHKSESSDYTASEDEMKKRRGVSGGLGRGKVMKDEEEESEESSDYAEDEETPPKGTPGSQSSPLKSKFVGRGGVAARGSGKALARGAFGRGTAAARGSLKKKIEPIARRPSRGGFGRGALVPGSKFAQKSPDPKLQVASNPVQLPAGTSVSITPVSVPNPSIKSIGGVNKPVTSNKIGAGRGVVPNKSTNQATQPAGVTAQWLAHSNKTAQSQGIPVPQKSGTGPPINKPTPPGVTVTPKTGPGTQSTSPFSKTGPAQVITPINKVSPSAPINKSVAISKSVSLNKPAATTQPQSIVNSVTISASNIPPVSSPSSNPIHEIPSHKIKPTQTAVVTTSSVVVSGSANIVVSTSVKDGATTSISHVKVTSKVPPLKLSSASSHAKVSNTAHDAVASSSPPQVKDSLPTEQVGSVSSPNVQISADNVKTPKLSPNVESLKNIQRTTIEDTPPTVPSPKPSHESVVKVIGRNSPSAKWSPRMSTGSATPPPRHPTPPRPPMSGNVNSSTPPPYRSSPVPATMVATSPSNASHVVQASHPPGYYAPPEHFVGHPGFPPGYHPPQRHPQASHHMYVPPTTHPSYPPHHASVLRGPHQEPFRGRGSPNHSSHSIIKSNYPGGLEPMQYSSSPGPVDATGRLSPNAVSEEPPSEVQKQSSQERGEFSSGLLSYFSSQREDVD